MLEYIVEGLVNGFYETTALEWIAVTMGILSVWYSMKENIWVYPTGIISTAIYIYITFKFKLYADMGVNTYYTAVSIYGWYYWLNTDSDAAQVPVTKNSFKENIFSAALLVGSFLILAYSLKNFTDSDVPIWDASTTSVAIVGMWLMARKKLESWVAWIATDLISIPLYFYKGLVLTSFQFVVFTVIAFMGYYAWKKSMQKSMDETAITANG